MIFAAGLGTRLKPLTDTIPKALVPIGDKPLLQHILEKTDGNGNTIVINAHHHSGQIKNFITITRNNWKSTIKISDESDRLLDTGGGIRKAAHLFCEGADNDDNSNVLIHNVDILSNANLQEFYARNIKNDATLLVSQRKTSRYLLFDQEMRLAGWTNIATGEIKSPYAELLRQKGCNPGSLTLNSRPLKLLAFSGIHSISPKVMAMMDSLPEKFSIMDFYISVCDKVSIQGEEKDDLKILDVGKLETLESATTFIKQL